MGQSTKKTKKKIKIPAWLQGPVSAGIRSGMAVPVIAGFETSAQVARTIARTYCGMRFNKKRMLRADEHLIQAFPGWDAKCPAIDQFLWDIFEDKDIIRLFWQWLGYCLSGHTHLQKMAIWCGGGGNGKSVLVDLCSALLGEYGADVPSELLLDSGRVADAGSVRT